MVHFFHFKQQVLFLGRLGPKNESCLFKMKIETYNHLHNILRIFDGRANFTFTTSETKRDVMISDKLVYMSCLTSCQTTSDLRS